MTTGDQTCPRCGLVHPGCAGHKKNDPGKGGPCGNRALVGGTVCRYHGGQAGQVKAAAAQRVMEAEAARQVATLGLPIDISPTDALLQEVQWTAGHVHWLRGKVQELERGAVESGYRADDAATNHPLVWGQTKVVDKSGGENPGTDTTESATPSIWYQLYVREREHLVTVCAAALRAGVEERKVRLAEAQGDIVVRLLRNVLDGLYRALLTAGLTDAQLASAWESAVAEIVPREIRAIAGGQA